MQKHAEFESEIILNAKKQEAEKAAASRKAFELVALSQMRAEKKQNKKKGESAARVQAIVDRNDAEKKSRQKINSSSMPNPITLTLTLIGDKISSSIGYRQSSRWNTTDSHYQKLR